MGNIVCNGVILPGNRITIPVFGRTSNVFTPSSTANTRDNIYTYTDKVRKGVPNNYTNPYITAINAVLVRRAYTRTISKVNNQSLLYRRRCTIYYGFTTGRGGNGGNGSQNWGSWDRGSGGGGGGCVLFWFLSDSGTTVTPNSSYANGHITISVPTRDVTIYIYADPGGDGKGKYTGGSGGNTKIVISGFSNETITTDTQTRDNRDGSGLTLQRSVIRDINGCTLIAFMKTGQVGGDGQGWNGQTTPGDFGFSIPDDIKNALGISDNISWNRNDGQGGSSIAPGVYENGNTSWYGSGGHSGSGGNGGRTDGQGTGARVWSITYEV